MSSKELRIFLVKYDFSQKTFAEAIGMSRQWISGCCKGKNKISQRIIDFCKEYEERNK